ncbi:MAG: AMP-binding protein [Candidatus Paracaedibacteraceae bacterium]|nr:AMP-binding protein [Candidatus Paracaedibacteraceae bacterium]
MLQKSKNKLSNKQLEGFNSLHFAFESHAHRTPKATALIWKEKKLSYYELNNSASFLANQIISSGVDIGSFVPILLPRSPSLVISLLAVLKAGAAYTLIDPCWPKSRIQKVINALKPKFIITKNKSSSFNGINILPPIIPHNTIEKTFPSIDVNPSSPSTVFFTSGTTGEPKGVISTHKGTMRLFKENNFVDFNSSTIIPLAAALPWDALSLELWGALVNGGSAWLIDEPYLSSAELRKGISKYGVNTAWITSSLFNISVEDDINSFTGLKQLMIGGERLSPTHVKLFLTRHPQIKLINGYGPVESTIFTTTHHISLSDCEISSGIPIGTPVPQTQVYILNEKMEICADDEVGQIYINGTGLAIGYLNDPRLTHNKFKEIAIEGVTKRVYSTGDLGFWKNNLLHFHGRNDRQVKVHGHRIELSDVEHQIEQHLHNIKSCRVVSKNNPTTTSQELIAFCIPLKLGDKLHDAHQQLKSKLVAYQCPSKVIPVDSFPLTPQGKLDEQALIESSMLETKNNTYHSNESYKTPIEKTIGKILSQILNQDYFPVDVPFSQLGLNSLNMGQLCSRLGKELNCSISLSKIYKHHTISSLGEFLKDNQNNVNMHVYFDSNKMNQMQLMYLTQHLVNPSNLASRCLMTWKIEGDLSLSILKEAINYVHINNKSLRSKYLLDFDSSDKSTSVPFPVLEILPSEESAEFAVNSLRSELSKDLNPLEGKIWKTAVISLANSKEYFFGCAIHHIAFDGYSEHLLAESLSEGYNIFSNSPNFSNHYKSSKLISPLSIYPSLDIEVLKEVKDFSKNLEGTPEIIWPQNFNKPQNDFNLHAENVTLILSAKTEIIDEFALKNRVSRFEVLFHAWIHALKKVTSQTDFCVGIPIRQRNHFINKNTINCHLNMLFPRITKKIFKNGILGLKETSRLIQRSLANQDIPLTQILQIIKSQKTGRPPLFQTLFALQDNPSPKLVLKELKTEFIRQPYLELPLELHAEIWPKENGNLCLIISWRSSLISDSCIQNIAKYFEQYLEQILNWSLP